MSKMSDYLVNQIGTSADYRARLDQNIPEPDNSGDSAPGFFSSLFHNALGGLEGSVGGGLNYLGAFAKSQGGIDPNTGWNSLGDWLINNGEYLNNQADDIQQQYGTLNKYQDETIAQRLTDLDYLTDSRGLTADIFNGLGSSVPFIAASMAAPELGVGGWLARGAGGALERMGAGRLGQAVASDLVQAGANDFTRYALTSGPLEAAVNAGGIYDDLKNQGLSDSEIFGKMNSMIGEELPVDMLTSGLYGAVLGGNTFSRLGQGGWKRAIAANILNTPADMLGEYMQEMTQQQVQNKYSGKPYGTFWNPTEDEMQAGRAAAMGALPMGMFGSARGAINSRRAAMAAADGGSVTGPEPVTPPAVPDPNVDPVEAAQLTGKNDDVPTADGIDVTNLDPQQYTQWYGDKLKAQGIDVPDATIMVQTPKATGTTGGAKAGAGANVMDAAQDFMGQHMENGANGCVEAVTKIGARYNPFLADELSKGVVNVDTLVSDAGDKVVPFDPNNLEAGDVIVYGDNDHVVLADGNGGYVGNSSSQQKVVQGGDYNNMDGLKPTKIIKTGNGVTAQNETANNGNAPAADLSSLPVGDIATAIAQNTGLPANFIWAQLSHESNGGNSKLAREDHNYGGVKGTDGEYLHFDNDQQFIDYMSNYYPKYREDGIYDAQTADQFAEALQHGGYFTADLGEYEGGMHRYLEQAGLSDSGTAGAPAEKQSTVNTMTQQQFGDMLNEKMIDFAGTNDDTVKAVFNDMSTSKDKVLVNLFAPYMQDGVFANTAANRAALANDDGFKKAMAMFLSKHLSDYAPAFENGKISFQQAEDALRPRHQVQAAQTAQAPNIQTVASPKMEAAAIQNVLSSFAQDKKNVARTEQEANLFDDMLDADDHFIDTPKNRQTLLKNYGAQLQNYVDDVMTPSLDDRVNQAIEQAIQNKDLNRMNILTQAKQANDTATLEKLVGPQTKQHVDIAAMLTPANTDAKNHVSSMMQGNALVHQTATMEHQASQNEVASTVQGNTPVQQAPATENEMPQGKVAPTMQANMPVNQAPARMDNQQAAQQDAPKEQVSVTTLPTQKGQQSEGVRIAQPQQTIDEQNAQTDARIAEIKKTPLAQRKALGQQYLDTLRQNNVSFSEKKLAKPLMNGNPKAIEHVQRTYGDLLNTITPAEAAAASQHAPRTIQAATTARLGNMVSEITSGNTYKNASPVGKLAYLSAASAHAKTVGADKSARAIDSIIADVRKKAGFSGKGTTEGMTSEQKDEFYNAFYKQSLDDAMAIRKEAADEKPANLKSLDNTIEMFKQELAKSKPTKEERKEDTHESTQSKSQNEPDKGAKNQDQHTKPEPRKAADTQRKAEESEVSATKKAADKGGRDEQTLSEKEVVLKHISTLFGKPITNKETGIVATFGTKGANKMVSNKAVDKTVKNGYSQHEHLEAVKDIKRLYEDAGLSVQHEDRDKSPNILSIKRFRTNMTTVDGNPATAKITVKETKQNGHKIYSIELEALEKPSELNHARADSSEGQTVRPTKGKQPSSAYADESSSSTHIIPHEQKEGTKNLDTGKVPAMGEPIHGIKGTETTVVTDSGKEIRVRYLAVPASRVITSHDAETMTPNKAYPQELQPRDRQRVSMQEQVTTMANELRPADLGAGRNLNQGAPIIRKDGVVLNGNGRAMAIQKATAAGGDKATAYRKYIFEHSKEFGLSRVNLAQVRKYMLVREVVDDIDANTMQDIINSTVGGSRMGASEQAKADAKKIKPSDLEQYADNENGDLTTAANRDFVASTLYRIISKSERNAYMDKFGNANADGIERVKRALFSLAYGDDGLISKMSESTDDNIRNVSRGLMSAAPEFANVNLTVKNGRAYDYDVAKTISEAVKRLDALRKEGKQVRDYLNEQSMFSEYQDTDEMRDVLRFFDDNKRSGKKIGIFLNDIANSIMMQGDPNQTSLMDGGRATLGEIIKTSARVASNGTSSADLFADVQEAPTKAKENTTQAIDDIRYSAKQNDAQVKRSLQAVVDEAKKAFPNAKNIRQDGGHISMDMPNGAEVQINVVPSIEVNNEEAGRARAAHGLKDDVRIKINGGERTVGRTALIELSQLGRKGTAYHEAFHAVYDMCLTNEEKAALHKAYDKEAKAKGRDVYEVMADKYRDWMLAQQKGQHTLFGKLWQKVKSAVIRLLHLIRSADNARDVFRKVGSGEVWERQLNSKDSGNRYLVTNDQIRPDTEVPIIDVTDEPKVNVNNHHAAADIARSMIGKTFRIIGSDGYGKIASVSDGTHFVHSSNNPVRFDKTRRKALSVAEKILGNCVYIEKHGDLKHGTKQSYIEMFSVVKDGNRLVRFRIVAKEGNKDSHAFRIGEAKFYDIIKDGALQESGVLRHYKHEGTPSTLTIAELLKGVKDREGHLYVNKDGSLNYDTRIFHNGEEQGGSPSDVRNSADLFAIRPGEPIRYSLDANDNSKPSLFTRAYNHLTGRKNAASHDKNVKAMLEDITKMRIRFGKLDPKTETVFKKFEGVIRARNANEWEKVLPEAGRAIADRLNLKPSEDMNNYIAKWLLDEATNDTSQEASDFAAALKNDPVLSDQLVDLKTLFNERNNREADEVVRDAIQYEKPKERTTLTKAWETFYDEMIEELGPVERMVKRVQEKSGQELAASVNPYIALRLFRGNAGRAMTMIEGQSEAAVKALQTNYPGVNFNGFKTLHMILDECGALHNEKRMKDFLAFALACHVKDIHTLNNRIRKSQQRLRDKIADLNDKINNLPEYQQLIESDKKVDDKYQEQREAYQKEIEGYQAKIDKAEKTIMEVPRTEDGLSLTEDRCNKVMMKYMKEYGEAQQDLVHFSKVTTSILYDAGVISKKRYKELQERWPNYIPMFRVFEDNEEVDFGDSLKHMHGSTRRIINPLDSIIRNTYDFVKKAERNKARQLLADLTRISDVGEYIEEVNNSKPNDKTTITFYENGERKYLQTDPDIVKAVNNMGREESNWVLRLLHGPAKIARACFTTINPSFALRNLIRDSTDATIYSKYGFKPWDFVRGFLHAVHRDELFYEWLSSGAAQASAISLDRDYTQATLNQMSKTWKERLLSKEFLPAILEGMQMVGEYSEYGTRIAAYERVKKKLAGENGPHPAAYDLVSAAFESRDLMDFARGGRGSRHLNNVVVFANASIQGFDKFFRTFDFRKPYRKESMKALARLFLCGMLPALLLAGIHSGDDWWEELPDWQKETNWILGKVGNTIIRIPKGQDIGLRFFSNLIEKAMDRSKHKAGDYFRPVWDSLPDMIPTALLPIIEATANHSYFTGAPIVPKYQEKLPAYLQFGNETSSFAKFVGKVIGVSPRKVEHVLFGYTGNMGKGLLGVYDTIVGNQSLNTNLNEAPVISGFTAIPYKQSKTVNDFYDKFDEQQRLNEEFKLTKKKPDGYDPSLYKRMTKAQQELSKINKQERAAIDDPKMDSGVREQKQLGYQQQRLSVVRRVMGQ